MSAGDRRIVGFTGTRRGMTQPQLAAVLYYFRQHPDGELHHGDCIGADENAHRLALGELSRIVIHPPDNPRLQAHCATKYPGEGVEIVELPPMGYIARNHGIVDVSDILIATPGEMHEVQRSGTWATIRYALKCKRPVFILYPDGSSQVL